MIYIFMQKPWSLSVMPTFKSYVMYLGKIPWLHMDYNAYTVHNIHTFWVLSRERIIKSMSLELVLGVRHGVVPKRVVIKSE